MTTHSEKHSAALNQQYKRLNQLVEQISSQDTKLNKLKALRSLVQQQTAINSKLDEQLGEVNRSVLEKDNELRQALNRVDNLNRQVTNHKRDLSSRNLSASASKYLNARNKLSSPSKNKTQDNNGIVRRVSFDPVALLLDAALEGELDLVKETSKKISDLSASHEENVTALHNAAVAEHYEVAKYLVQAGCDINVQDSDGWTPLHCAASCNNLQLIKLLVENGASVFAATYGEFHLPIEKCDTNVDGYADCSEYLTSIQENLGVANDGKVYALYDYEAQEKDELSFKTDDELIILRRGDNDEKDWWWASKQEKEKDGTEIVQEGYIPRNLIGMYPRAKKTININENAKTNPD